MRNLALCTFFLGMCSSLSMHMPSGFPDIYRSFQSPFWALHDPVITSKFFCLNFSHCLIQLQCLDKLSMIVFDKCLKGKKSFLLVDFWVSVDKDKPVSMLFQRTARGSNNYDFHRMELYRSLNPILILPVSTRLLVFTVIMGLERWEWEKIS